MTCGRARELRVTLIEKHAKIAATKIAKLKTPKESEIAILIAEEFKSSPV
jgi:hypothetical protein